MTLPSLPRAAPRPALLPLALLLLVPSCGRRADSSTLYRVVSALERDARAIERGDSGVPTVSDWHYFAPGSVRPPVRLLDSRAGFIYAPSVVLAELGSGEKLVACSLAPEHYQVYRLSAFTVPWTKLCPHDLNFVATPPSGAPP